MQRHFFMVVKIIYRNVHFSAQELRVKVLQYQQVTASTCSFYPGTSFALNYGEKLCMGEIMGKQIVVLFTALFFFCNVALAALSAKEATERLNQSKLETLNVEKEINSELKIAVPEISAPSPIPAEVSTSTLKLDDVDQSEDGEHIFYIGAGGGWIDYVNAVNVESFGGGAMTLGYITPLSLGLGGNLGVEGNFTYSNHVVTLITGNENYDQYLVGGSLKYYWNLNGAFIPFVGGILAYNRRVIDGFSSSNTSNAFDSGGLAGFEVPLTRSILLGFEGRIMSNLDYQRERPISADQLAQAQATTSAKAVSLEEITYYTVLLNAKIAF